MHARTPYAPTHPPQPISVQHSRVRARPWRLESSHRARFRVEASRIDTFTEEAGRIDLSAILGPRARPLAMAATGRSDVHVLADWPLRILSFYDTAAGMLRVSQGAAEWLFSVR
jgi:hypothetical protein